MSSPALERCRWWTRGPAGQHRSPRLLMSVRGGEGRLSANSPVVIKSSGDRAGAWGTMCGGRLARLQHREQIRRGTSRSKGRAADRQTDRGACVLSPKAGWEAWSRKVRVKGASCCGDSLILPLLYPPACCLLPFPFSPPVHLPSHGSSPWPLASAARCWSHSGSRGFPAQILPGFPTLSRQTPPSFPAESCFHVAALPAGGWTGHTQALPRAFEPAVLSIPVPFPFFLAWRAPPAYLQSPYVDLPSWYAFPSHLGGLPYGLYHDGWWAWLPP